MNVLAIGASVAAVLVLVTVGCGGSDESSASTAVPFDRAFIDAMVPHHQQAIEMAKEAKAAGLSEPVLLDIANAIAATQQDEIDRMLEWRAEWFGEGEVDPDGAGALGMSPEEMGMQHGAMDFEIAADVDAAFAAAMIDHHEGAVTMARLASRRAEHDEIRRLAEDVIAAQESEIEQMTPFAASVSDPMDGMGHG
jgi:uncharacterized protein (DUF305 family)